MSDMFSVSSERPDDDVGVVVLSGEVDIFTAPSSRTACSSCWTRASSGWLWTSPT